jgi:hypothetical protein
MDETEQAPNDLEVEIKDLDLPGQAAARLRHSLAKRAPRRLLLILLNSLLILAVILIVGKTTSVRTLVGSIFLRATPSPARLIVPGEDLYYVRASPPWGRLFIDGRLTSVPTIGSDPPLRLAPGRHLLSWQAAPFLPQTCFLSIPNNFATDTCQYNETVEFGSKFAGVILFTETLATLPITQRNALLQATQSALDALQSTDTVQRGEHYTLAANDPACKNTPQNQCSAIATQPLQATLSFRLDTNENSNDLCIDPQSPPCYLFAQDCRLFCSGSFSALANVQEWDVFAPVKSLWTFATMSGQVLARDIPDASSWEHATGQTMDESLVPLRITWDSLGWHVAAPADLSGGDFAGYSGYFDPVCAGTVKNVSDLNPPVDAQGKTVDLQWQFVSGPLRAAGCLVVGTPLLNGLFTPTPPRPPQPVIYCLYRFGVLLLVNSALPTTNWPLPHADSHEQQLARQLISLLPVS